LFSGAVGIIGYSVPPLTRGERHPKEVHVAQISVATEAVQAAGQQIQTLSTEIERLIVQLQQTATSVQGEWRGAASSAFESAMGEWQAAANNIQMAAAQIGKATHTAGANYEDTETANTSMFNA
jgi:WXG100 family type VII secretion target